MKVSGKTQQRLVHRCQLDDSKCESKVAQISVDGGKVRLRTEKICTYLQNHRHRIIDYKYFQQYDICAITSGAVESTVKQIDRRLKTSGAQC